MAELRSPLPSAEPLAEGAPDLRSPLVQSEPIAEGAPQLRSPLVQSEPVAEGAPSLRTPLVQGEPLTDGAPQLRGALVLTEVLVDLYEEPPLPTAIFPVLRGLAWDIKKNPEFKSARRQVASGREAVTAFMQWPIWHFEMVYDWVPDLPGVGSGFPDTDLRTLQGFFLQMQGAFQAFLFRDPDDFHVQGGEQGVGDGTTVYWYLTRDFGGFLEPVGQIDLSVVLSFGASAVNTTTSAINVPDHGLTTGQGPLFISASSGGALPTGLAASTPYWVIALDADHFQLASSRPNANAGTAITLTAQGSGADTLAKGWSVYETITETDGVPASDPYTVTVANASTWVSDGGVTIGGSALTKVSGSPGPMQYSVSAGTYTFNAAQASASAAITYTWRMTAALLVPNQLLLETPPAPGAVVTADFDFWFVCRFAEDQTEFNKFSNKLWDLQKLDFQSVIQ